MEDKKLKIGIFIDTFYPMVDGVINVVNNHASRFNKFADVTVFAPCGRQSFDDSTLPYKVVRCTKKLKLNFLDYDLPLPKMDKKFVKEINESDFDIIHIHSPFSIGKLGVETAKKKKIPVVATLHSQFKRDFYSETKSELIANIMIKNIISVFNKCNECFAVNKQVGKVFKSEYGLRKNPKVQNNGTDLAYYDNDIEVENLRKQYNIKDDEKVFLFVGRINRVKNIFFTLDVLKDLKDKNFKYKMFFVGTGPDEKDFAKKIKEFNLENEVILTGKITDRNLIIKHFRLADLFVFPSVYDCSSLVQIEAASQKTPTIFIRNSVTSGTATENVDCFCEEEDVVKFSNKIIEIFNNEELYNKVKEGCFNNLYVTWDEVSKKVYNDYLTVIENYKNGKYSKATQKQQKTHKKEMLEVVKEKNKAILKDKKDNKKKEKNLLKNKDKDAKKIKNKKKKK